MTRTLAALTKTLTAFLSVIIISGGCTTMHTSKKIIEDSAGQKALPLASPTKLPFEKVLPGPVSDYEVMRADGTNDREYILTISRLSADGFTLKGTYGRSCSKDKPWLMVRNIKTQKGLAASLAYSGNWSIEVMPYGENTLFRMTTLPASLKPFKTVNGLPIPGALVTEFAGHWDNGAQPIVRFIRARLLRNLGENWPLVQYNTWYDQNHKLNEAHLIQTAGIAAELGCELFVIDAGWYGYGKNIDWSRALGQWNVNPDRFPNGLEPVMKEVRKCGMKFGIWVEIENANPNSPVVKAHPDWLLRDDNNLASRRACLDFGNPQALAWAIAELDRIITGCKLDYIKMDFNTDLDVNSEKYTGYSDPLSKHYQGLVKLWDHMRTSYPNLIIENCSSGSRRQDILTAAHTDTHWVSDAVSNQHNLAMNFSVTYLFPPEICNHWTCFPDSTRKIDLQSCFTINMLGQMGLSGQISTWNEKTLRFAAESIQLYKKIRPIIRNADVYHLTDQTDYKSPHSVQAVQYTDRGSDRTVVFVFHAGDPAMTANLKLRDLNPDTVYNVCPPPAFGEEKTATGKSLMTNGLDINFPNRGASAIFQIEP